VTPQQGDPVKAPSDTKSRNKLEKDEAYQAHLQSLTDQLLLFVRDGQWRKVSELATWLAPRLKPEFAIRRFLEAGGTHEKKLEHKAGAGQQIVLQDILDALERKQLLAVRHEVGEEEIQSTPVSDDRFEIDPEFAGLLPRAPDEVKKLEERLLAEPPRDPLVVWQGQRTLIDGHTRFRFFALLGRSNYTVVEMAFPDRAAVIAWIYATHYGRRSYSQEMKSYVRGKQYLARKQPHGGARKKASAQSGHLKTASIVAAEYGIGSNTVRRDAAFAVALDQVADRCGDEVRQQVLSRLAKWTHRDVARLAQLDQATLQETVRAALASGKRPKFPAPAEEPSRARKAVSLPLQKPVEQVRVLRKVLGGKGLQRLHKAITRFLEKPKGTQPN
jgi:hypothetical protein